MKIGFRKSFIKQYASLNLKQRGLVDFALKLFEADPDNPKLKNHALKGRLKGYRAVYAAFDLRVIFRVEGNYVYVEIVAVGSHNQVY